MKNLLSLRMVPLFVAAFACPVTTSIQVHADTFAKSTGSSAIGQYGSAPTLQQTGAESNPTLGRAAKTPKVFTPSGYDMLIPVQIDTLSQSRGGTFLQFDFHTTAPTAAMICLSKTWIEPVPSVSGDWTVSGSVERLAFSPTGVNHSVVAKSLDPGSVYFIVILLNPPEEYDIAGWLPYHTFNATRQRRVTVSIPMIFVIDDSDDLSAGDLAFRFQIGPPSADFTTPGNSWDHVELPATGNIQIDSGDDYWPIINMYGTNVGDEVTLTAYCTDSDSWSAGQYNTPDTFKSPGSNSVAEWNSGAWTFNVAGGTDMSPGDTPAENEEFEIEFIKTVNETDDTCLEYQVWGSIYVWYQ